MSILLVCNRSLFSRELRECMNLFVGFNSKGTRKDRVICELEMNFKKSFCLLSSTLSNDNIIS